MPDSPSPAIGSWPWLRERLFPRGTNLIQWASYIILTLITIQYVMSPPAVGRFQFFSTLFALALLLVINFLLDDLKQLLPNEDTSTWIIMLVSAGLTFYTILVGGVFIAIYIIFMIAAQANAMLPSVPAVGFSILMAGAYLGLLGRSGASAYEMQNTAIGLLLGMTFTITLSQVLLRFSEQTNRANHLLEQLRQANLELVAARQKEKELAVAEERVRVARDLHDGLGHHLTALSILLQTAEKLLRANPDLADEAVHNARSEVQAALQEVRQSVAALRETPLDIQNLPQAIARLMEETGKLTGQTTSFQLEGKPAVLSAAAAMTLYRTVLEGLTNVQKHAVGASQVQARLTFQKSQVRLVLEDNGTDAPSSTIETGQGFGLAGLRERASLLGGELRCGPRAGAGFYLEISLPLDAQNQGEPA